MLVDINLEEGVLVCRRVHSSCLNLVGASTFSGLVVRTPSGGKDYLMCVTGEHRVSGISVANVVVFVAAFCTAGTQDRLPDPVNEYAP